MKEDIRAFMFDLDGTLIDTEYHMSKKTVEALKTLKENGYKLIVNSGRPIFLSEFVYNNYLEPDFFDYVYGNNGCEYLNNQTKKVELLCSFSPEELSGIVHDFDDDMFYLGAYGDNRELFVNRKIDNDEIKKWLDDRELKEVVIDYDKNDMRFSKLVSLHCAAKYDQAVEYLKTHTRDFYSCSPSSARVIEVVPKGISKLNSCMHLMTISDLKLNEIISFGDSDNDILMLQNTNGVCMGNARSEVKELFKEVTDTVNDDGVYKYLKKENYI